MEECFAAKNPDTVNGLDYAIDLYRPGTDDLDEITAMLHRAYAPLAAAGMNYVAATQSSEVTGRRLMLSTASWVARRDGHIIGLVSYYSSVTFAGAPELYALGHVGVFAQFAVEPELQKRGVGYELLKAVEKNAVAEGKTELSCDTAENATHLRHYYGRLGFREVATHRFPQAAYTSIIFSKTLNGASHRG